MKKLAMVWDYRMRWAPFKRKPDYRAGGWPYPFTEEVFIEDFKRCIDFLAVHGYEGIVIWGLFRDSHGGERAVKFLCDYANKRRVGILPFIGVGCYGGAYWEGEHHFNLDTFLRTNPSLAAVDTAGNPILKGQYGHSWSMACLSHPLVKEWTLESVKWLATNFDIRGIEFQCGDYGLCACSRCRERGLDSRTTKFSFSDVAYVVPDLMTLAHQLQNNLLLMVTVYMAVRKGQNLAGALLRDRLPPYAYVNWWCHSSPVCLHPAPAWPTLDCDLVRYLQNDEELSAFTLPGPHNIGQMAINTTAYYADHYIFLDSIAKMTELAHRIKLDGLMIYGELREFSNLVNYLALKAFLENPRTSMVDFWKWAHRELTETGLA